MSNVIQLPSAATLRTPIGHVIRTGEIAYKQLENLHAEGRLPAKSLIIDASKIRFQKQLIESVKAEGAEVILDTKVAELSEVGRYQGAAKDTPWAITDRPLAETDFEVGSNFDLYGRIARCAVETGMTAVLAASHFLRDGTDDAWIDSDLSGIARLRSALDREGGRDVAIDYALIIPHTRFQDGNHRARLIQRLRGLPFDNLVVRLSGFGATAAPLAIKHTFLALGDLRALGVPIVLDHLGGLVGLSAVAFGFASGLAHGIGERDSFDARSWHLQPKKRDPDAGFGRAIYVPIPGLDRSFSPKDLKLIAGATGGRRLISCPDRSCCAHGVNSMIDEPRAHIASEKFRAIHELFEVPDARRVSHFLQVCMREAERKAGDLARLNTGNEKLNSALLKARKRIDSMTRMYETLAESNRTAPPPTIRRAVIRAVTGRGAS
jgi:hypothetical protein